MKASLFLLLLLFRCQISTAQIEKINPSLYQKFSAKDFSSINNIKDLVSSLKPMASSGKENLQLLYFWTYKYMSVDSVRFFKNTAPSSVSESLAKKAGMCEEFSNIFYEYCKLNHIPSLKVEGYVRPINFKPGQKFEEGNHIWNAVLLDSEWYVCDLLWGISSLQIAERPYFIKEAKPEFILASPDSFLSTHLPLSPVFQFESNPIRMEAFTSQESGFSQDSPRLSGYHYKDSLNVLLMAGEKDRAMKVARQAFAYNPDNPNILIITAFNNAIDIINQGRTTPSDLKKAKLYLNTALSYFSYSNKKDLMPLKDECNRALAYVNKNLGLQK